MKYEMRLNPVPFEMIKSGRKTIELRLFDEKRRKIRLFDRIEFTSTALPHERIEAEVIGIYRFDSFRELYVNLPLLKFGYTEENISAAKPKDMDAYYTPEQQEKYGVVGIEIELV